MDNIFFYHNADFIDIVDAENSAKELASTNINCLFQNKRENKIFQEEILPIIVIADILKYTKIKFTENTNVPMDAILKDNDKELYIEWTT